MRLNVSVRGARALAAISWMFAAFLLVPAVARAQTSAGIAGSVRDVTGAVLPGATVEVASPALIEKVRTAVTDGQGRYTITDLRPGTYSVTVTLTGFSTFKREGIEVSAGFNATVNADLKVGALEETVTVSGSTPIVDTQNSRSQQVVKAETMYALPTSQSLTAFAAMTLGASSSTAGRNDVGGDKGDQSTGIILHGGRGDDGRTNWDGMNTNVFFGNGGGQQRVYLFNTVGVQEVVVDTGGNSAEIETGGANLNMVPKDGGNSYSIFGTAAFTNKSFATKAVSDSLAARGAQPFASIKDIWDYGIGVGGPIQKDRIWFYTPNRWWGTQNYGVNAYYNKSPNFYEFVADTSRPQYTNGYYADNAIRLTIQASKNHKITQEEHLQHGSNILNQGVTSTSGPEASTDFLYGPQILSQTTWNYTVTNKLLIQAGATFLFQKVLFANAAGGNNNYLTGTYDPVYPDATHVSINDRARTITFNAVPASNATYGDTDNSNNFNQKFSVSYITGSHAIKAGFQALQGIYDTYGMQRAASEVNYQFFNGTPTTIIQFAGPFTSRVRVGAQALYAMDQWTLNRLTLNLGVRFDHFQGHTLAQDLPAGPFIAARHVDQVNDVPNYKDITPRLGVSYDVFGNGKTAIKAAFGRYLYGQGGGDTKNVDPATAIVSSTSRTWTDANSDYIPQCNLANSAANGECGASVNTAFGQPNPIISYSADAAGGWNHREYNYQTSIQLQHELFPKVGIAVGYFRTWWGNERVIRDLAHPTPADFNEICVTAPNDPALQSVAGTNICGYYAPKTLTAQRYQIVTADSTGLGEPKEVYNGVDFAVNARWGKGALVQGGITVGRENVDYCFANGHPELTPFGIHGTYLYSAALTQFPNYPQSTSNGTTYCKIETPWWDGIGSQAKLQVVYPLPYDFQVSGSWKTLPGVPIEATLFSFDPRGRTLPFGFLPASIIPFANPGGIGGGGQHGVQYDERLYQTDVRFTKSIKIGRTKLLGNLDIYNVFNQRVSQGNLATIGAPGQFLAPTSVLGGRLVKFGGQVSF